MKEEICPKVKEMNDNREDELHEYAYVDITYCEGFCFGRGCKWKITCPTYLKLKNG